VDLEKVQQALWRRVRAEPLYLPPPGRRPGRSPLWPLRGENHWRSPYLVIANRDAQSKDYQVLEQLYRPSHADYTYAVKYGHRDPRGEGRSSARETAGAGSGRIRSPTDAAGFFARAAHIGLDNGDWAL
jgi:hypothetical protein